MQLLKKFRKTFDQIQKDPNTNTSITAFFYYSFFLLLIILSGIYFLFLPRILNLPFGIEFGEGLIIDIVEKHIDKINIYENTAIFNPPFTFNPYNPLYYYISSLFFDPLNPIKSLRFFQYIVASITTIVIFLLSLNYFRDLNKALFSIILFPLSSISFWLFFIRVDGLALLFALSGVYIFLKQKDRGVVFASFFFFLAFLTKQSMIGYFLGILFYLIIRKRYTTALSLLSPFIMLSGLSFYLLISGYGEGYITNVFYLNTIQSYDNLPSYFIHLVLQLPITIYLLIALYFTTYTILKNNDNLHLFLIFLISLILSSLLFFKNGSADNYFLEPLAISNMFIIDALFKVKNNISKVVLFWVIIIFSLSGLYKFILLNNETEQTSIKTITDIIADSKNIYSEHVDLAIAFNKSILLNDVFIYNELLKTGRIKRDYLAENLRSKLFDTVILTRNLSKITPPDDRFSNETIAAINDNYYLYYNAPYLFNNIYIYKINKT